MNSNARGDCSNVSLSTKVLIGLVLGLGCGLFFGEHVGFLGVIGEAFIRLLQMTVLPYIVVSLIWGLGSLSYADAVSLARKAGGFLVLLWGIILGVLCLIPLAYPSWPSASFFSHNLVDPRQQQSLIELYIPANPFESLAESVVPAVVLFTIAVGVSLIGIERKEAVLEMLGIMNAALTRIMDFVVSLAPVGIFAIVASAAGTMDPSEVSGLEVYVTIYMVMSTLLVFWVLPFLVSSLTSLGYRQVVMAMRDPLVTAFATGSVFVVLPVLVEKSKELMASCLEEGDAAENMPDVIVPTAFNLPSLGKLLSLSFIPFAGWLSGYAITGAQFPSFLTSGFLSFFGSTMMAVPFLLDLYQIPSDTFRLFVIADNIVGNRFGAGLASVHILALSLLSTAALSGNVQIRWRRVGGLAVSTLLGVLVLLGGVRLGFDALGPNTDTYQVFVQRSHLLPTVPVTYLDDSKSLPPEEDDSRTTLERIRDRGILRVAYLNDRLPYAFSNADAELVGFDIEMAHQLAADLEVELAFIRVQGEEIIDVLSKRQVDVVMSGILVTPPRLEKVTFSASYLDETLAFVVPDHRREDFASREALMRQTALRIAVPRMQYWEERLRTYLPDAEIVAIDSPRVFFRQEGEVYDAMLLTAESGASWSLVYPNYAVAVPKPDIVRAPLAYPVTRGDSPMADFLSAWIELRKRDMTIQNLYDYWILGKTPPEQKKRRWSILHDVLGW